ncbi:hypothetical protein SAMN05216276_108618 [Streptosporangium subroseum]|uniref:Uncharacterized protein n=1 Tax=Streptosporangium subroseum TaxID=106412 RepID=A0A239P4B4_9ACTN|nr:hypothetical protein [Streptosporangium subroseum]SNT61916.1 hypothetical protein SAMN05216276_108618 [Streptosporangium subroseum]
MRIKIIFILFTVILAVSSPALAENPNAESIFRKFTPNGVIDGLWSSNGQLLPSHIDVPGTDGCEGHTRSWNRKDHVGLDLTWYDCSPQQIRMLFTQVELRRSQTPDEVKTLSVLRGNADFVLPRSVDDPSVRVWAQGDLFIKIRIYCGPLASVECASLSAPVARRLASALPDAPRDSNLWNLFPPFVGIFSGLILFWLLVVVVKRLHTHITLERFDLPAGRIHPVDEISREMRRTRRRRWWGWLLSIYGALCGVSVINQIVHGASVWVGVILAVLTLPMGLLLLRTRQHRYLKRAQRTIYRPKFKDLLWLLLVLILGIFAVAIPALVLVGWFLIGLIDSGDSFGYVFGFVLIAGITVGGFIDRGAIRLRARGAREAMRRDERPYFLYLRNFGDDIQKIPASRFNRRSLWQKIFGPLSFMQRTRFEEIFTRELRRYGPIIAVGPPDTNLRGLFSVLAPQLGASRARLPHDTWDRQVRSWAVNAGAVVVSATPQQINSSFAWELKMLAQDLPHQRVVLICGPGDKRALHRTFGTFMSEVGRYELFRDLTTGWLTDGVLVLVHVPSPSGGTWHGWGAEQRTAWTYTAAVNAAMEFAHLNWARQETTMHLSSGPAQE